MLAIALFGRSPVLKHVPVSPLVSRLLSESNRVGRCRGRRQLHFRRGQLHRGRGRLNTAAPSLPPPSGEPAPGPD